jgi:hypothetical protein
VRNPFTERFGKPSPRVPTDIRFRGRSTQRFWEATLRSTGSGWFSNGFLYLFGGGLQRLTACCDAWSFLVPPGRERLILGRNAYGTLLVLEDPERKQQVFLLDPIRVAYWTDAALVLPLVIGRWLPKGLLPHFLDDALYRAWTRDSELPEGTIIAPIRPAGLGGEMVPENFQEEEIVDYYESTAPIYARAFSKAKSSTKKRPARKRKR